MVLSTSVRFRDGLSLPERQRAPKANAQLKPYLQTCRLAVLQTKRRP